VKATLVAILILAWAVITPAQASGCTIVLGFSQTNQWFTGGFEQYVPSSEWEMQYQSGASIDHFVDPNDPVWTSTIVSSCGTPTRALLNVSGDYSSDVQSWADRSSTAVTNIRSKYPTVGDIYLQPVVGGPNYTQCTIGGNIVRASYNAPYIATAIDTLVTSTVKAGPHPTVTSCAHFADDIGHLSSAPVFDYVARDIANFYNAPAATATATPTGTTPTPTPVVSETTVTFNDLTPANRVLSGQYPTGVIDWGTNQWYLSGPYGQFSTNSVGFNGPSRFSGPITILNGRSLTSVQAFNGGGLTTVTLTCGSVQSVTTIQPSTLVTISPGFVSGCAAITFASSNGWDTNFDNLVLAPASATATPTVVPTATPTPTNTPTPPPAATATPTPAACRVWVSINGGPGEWRDWNGC